MTSRPRHATPVTSLGALVGAFLAACGGPPPTVTTCLTRDDCGSVEICLGGRCVVPTIDAASGDSGRTVDSGPVDSGTVDAPIPDVGVLVDSGRPPPDAFSEVDDASAPGDASGPLPTASGHLFVLTGGTQRILSFAIAPDGAPSETGALDVYHPGRAIIARPDGNGLYIWAASAGPMASLETFAVSGDSAVGPGYTLDIGGGSLPVAAPLAHTPDGRFVYGGYVMGGGSIAQLQSGVGSFGTLTPDRKSVV